MTTSLPRLWLPEALTAGARLTLDRARAHYLVTVLRARPGASVLLFNGRDGEWQARLETATRSAATLVVDSCGRPPGAEALADVWLLFAPLRKGRTETVVEKATELGATALGPVFTRRSVVDRVNTERLEATAVEAAEQCERLSVPEVRAPVALHALADHWPRERRLLVAAERRAAPALASLAPAHAGGPVALLVGPEGGFEPAELDALAVLPFVAFFSLGPRVLRADTAALAAMTLWQALAPGTPSPVVDDRP